MNSPDSKFHKKRGTEQNAASTPAAIDAATLAHLVAQPRFTNFPNKEAIDAALKLLHDCQSALEIGTQQRSEAQSLSKEFEKPPMPAKFPATLDDFYRLIVKAKKKTDNQPRFRRFLRWQIKEEERFRMVTLEESRKQLVRLEQQIADAKKRGITLTRQPIPGCISTEEAVPLLRKAIAQYESRRCGAEEQEKELDTRFAHYAVEGFDETAWFICGDEYPRWWLPEKSAIKQAAGRARAKKAYEAKKSETKSTLAS